MRTLHRSLVLSLALLAAAPVAAAGAQAPARAPRPFAPGRQQLNVQVGGWRRHAAIEVPPQARAGRSLPVVVGLHGAGGSGTQFLDQNGWAAKAVAAGFVAVAPDGLPAIPRLPPNFLLNPAIWNNGELEPGSPRTKIDDVAFIAALLDAIARRVAIDPRRVYVTGHSAGAGMTFRLGAELASRWAAIAPVASHCWIEHPRPRKPLPTLYLIGTADPLVPVDGGWRDLPWGPPEQMPPVAQSLERWAAAMGCAPTPPVVEERPGLAAQHFTGCRSGVPFAAYFIAGQGHGWPGGETNLPPSMIGPSVDTVDATDFIWEFLRQQRGR